MARRCKSRLGRARQGFLDFSSGTSYHATKGGRNMLTAIEKYFNEIGELFASRPTIALGLVVIGSSIGFIMQSITSGGNVRRRRR